MDKKAEIGSPWLVLLPSREYFIVVPSLRTHDSKSLNKIFTHEIKFLSKAYFSKTEIKKLWSNESNAFSMTIATKKPSVFFSDF